MSDCEKCNEVRALIMGRIIFPLQRLLRKISGSEDRFIAIKRVFNDVFEAGSSIEYDLMSHEQVTSAWLENLTQRVERLEKQNMQLKEKVRVLSGQGGEAGEPAANQ